MNGRLTAACAFAFALAGCTAAPIVTVHPVLLPTVPRPVLPAVAPEEVQCLAPDVYTRLVDREQGYRQWGLKLEAIIAANNAKAGH